jgi:hypothetical protein
VCSKISKPVETLHKKFLEKLNGEMELVDETDWLRFKFVLAPASDGF